LAAGCCVVIKPAELAPFSGTLFGQTCLEAGLPAGVVNVVPGGPDAGEALVRHPGISKISFTGGVETAKAIQAAAASSLTPLLLELGGKSANIVFADSDLETAASVAVSGLAALNGQTCIAPTRLLVERRRYDEVLDAVRAGVGALRLGDPFAADTVMGPVISERAVDRILGVIDGARAEGAGRLIAGGARLEQGMGGGFFVEPTVFADVDNASSLAQSEIFGPVLSVMPFADEAEAVALANATTYGLSAYVQTTDLERAHRVAHALDGGHRMGERPGQPDTSRTVWWFQSERLRQAGRPIGRLGVHPGQERQYLDQTAHQGGAVLMKARLPSRPEHYRSERN
jgi:acyl-CoA reductase-like NAD-dependent aldehyde dehydrogenase